MRLATKSIIAILLPFILSMNACTSVETPSEDDPFESFNRTMYEVNDKLDKGLIRPVARGYDAIVPHKIQNRITLFFKNISLLPSIANNLLQADISQALENAAIFSLNATLGIGGFFDANQAFHVGLTPQDNDLGATLATYGAKESEFIMLPLFGPQTSRQAMAMPFAMNALAPASYLDESGTRVTSQAIEVINFRSAMLPTDKLVKDAFDPYLFVKDAYMQNRNAKINAILGVTSESSDEETFLDTEEGLDDDLDFFEDLEMLDDLDLTQLHQRPHSYNLARRKKNR